MRKTSELASYDPCHRTITQCLDVHAVHEAAPIRAAGRGAQETTERPRTSPPVARATRRPSGRTGRLLGDSAVPVSTAAAIVVRAPCFSTLSEEDRWTTGLGAFPFLLHRRVVSIVDIFNVSHGAFAPYGRHAYSRAFSGPCSAAPVACPSTSHVLAANASVFFLTEKSKPPTDYSLFSSVWFPSSSDPAAH